MGCFICHRRSTDIDVQADLIPELETAGDRFRRAKDPQGNARKKYIPSRRNGGLSGPCVRCGSMARKFWEPRPLSQLTLAAKRAPGNHAQFRTDLHHWHASPACRSPSLRSRSRMRDRWAIFLVSTSLPVQIIVSVTIGLLSGVPEACLFALIREPRPVFPSLAH